MVFRAAVGVRPRGVKDDANISNEIVILETALSAQALRLHATGM